MIQRMWLHPKSPGESFSLLSETLDTTKFVVRYCASTNGTFPCAPIRSFPHQNSRHYRSTTSTSSASTSIVPDNTKSSSPLPRNLALEAIKEAGWKQLEDTTLLVAKKAHKSLLLKEDHESKPNVKQLRLASRLLDMLEDIVHEYCIRVAELCDADGDPMIEV